MLHPDAPPRVSRPAPRLALALAALMVVLMALPASAADRDGDGLRDRFEARYGVTSPDSPDSDGDGVVDSAEDSDGDGLSELGEQRFGWHPGRRDSDGDGRSDGREDSDRDGRSDALEQDSRPLPKGLRPTLKAAQQDLWARHRACGSPWPSSSLKRCRYGDPGAVVSIAVVGDSKAMMLMPAFIAATKQLGWRLETLLKGSCSPVLGTLNAQAHDFDRGRACERWRRKVIESLNAAPPTLVVYVHSDDYRLVDARGRTVSGAGKASAWEAGVGQTVAALPDASLVVWLGDVPRNVGNPLRCLSRHRRDMSACVTRRQPLAKRPVETAIRRAVKRGGGRFRTLHDQVCTYDPCPLVQGQTLMWRDEGHLTVTFTRRLAPSMRDLLASLFVGGG